MQLQKEWQRSQTGLIHAALPLLLHFKLGLYPQTKKSSSTGGRDVMVSGICNPTCIMIKHRGHILLWKGVVGIAHQETRFTHCTVSNHDTFQHDRAGSVSHDPDRTTIISPAPCCSDLLPLPLLLLLGGDPRTAAGITSLGGGLQGAPCRAGAASLPPPAHHRILSS
ncbi:hypothetical protein CHARACLAT_005814 [Characodon lateralis]|uniref:Uncharacterized protein n=1 Tax=Characodon lateralis TaxID=208331 RepID=A0ABU7E7M0_9TELE|nr:hypothetical protein [Characodon lateralis]